MTTAVLEPAKDRTPVKGDRAVVELDELLGQRTVGSPFVDEPKIRTREVNVFYGDVQAIHGVSLDIGRNQVISMIGPSGCGKSTFLRALNRMNDTVPGCRVKRQDRAMGAVVGKAGRIAPAMDHDHDRGARGQAVKLAGQPVVIKGKPPA